MARYEFTIGVPPITKKNHSQIVKAGNRYRIIPSKQYLDYESKCAPYIPRLGIDYAVNVKATFYLPKNTRAILLITRKHCLM